MEQTIKVADKRTVDAMQRTIDEITEELRNVKEKLEETAKISQIINSSVVTEPGFIADARLMNPSLESSPLYGINQGLAEKFKEEDFIINITDNRWYVEVQPKAIRLGNGHAMLTGLFIAGKEFWPTVNETYEIGTYNQYTNSMFFHTNYIVPGKISGVILMKKGKISYHALTDERYIGYNIPIFI